MPRLNIALILTALLLAALLLAGCGGTSEAEFEATLAAALAATQTAVPSATPIALTATPEPTATPSPQPTHTPTSTPTAVPTDTPTVTATPTAVPAIIETKLRNGDVLYELPEIRFSIALPRDWRVVDLTDFDFSELLSAAGEQNDQLKSLFNSPYLQSLVAAGMKFYALNISSSSLMSSSIANINLLLEELPFDLTTEEYATVAIGQMERFFDFTMEPEWETLTLGDREVVRVVYAANVVNVLGQTIEVFNTQYLFVEDSTAYIVSLSMEADMADEYWEQYTAAVETFRLGERER